MAPPRHIHSELLDHLAPDDPRARRSRRDLQRVHRAMRSLSILEQGIDELIGLTQPRTILELGAGDGSLMLRLARARKPPWTDVDLTLLDWHDIVSEETRAEFRKVGWKVATLCIDVKGWSKSTTTKKYDLCVATLFLHHFDQNDLQDILSQVAESTHRFIASEPRRSALAQIGGRCVGCLGVNRVTREDAVKSVAAGFIGTEIGASWPGAGRDWRVAEYAAWPFSHVFVATRVPTSR